MSSFYERTVRAWTAWGLDFRSATCSNCGQFRFVRRPWKGRRWLCLDCFDQLDEHQRDPDKQP